MIGRLWRKVFPAPVVKDGFGQSFAQDLLYVARFLRCRRQAVTWRAPTPAEEAHWAAHPIVGRFGDETVAVARVDGRDWVVRENLFWGWPDSDRYPFFVLDGERIWAATEFNQWPRVWGDGPPTR